MPLRPYPDTFELPHGGFRLHSPAKLNLGLHVIGKRPDGYHELETLYQEIDWFDDMEFHPSSGWSLEVVGSSEVSAGPGNLITKAAQLLAETAGTVPRGRVVLHKSLPVGGGVGGGSSNGALALIGLSRLWGLDWPVSRLHPLAARLGSDCAFFLYGGLAIGRGRGELLELLPANCDGAFLLAVPNLGIRTPWVFENAQFPLTDSAKSVILQSRINPILASENWPAFVFNDLENIVLESFPEIAALRQRIAAAGAEAVLLSGSGSCVFGIFRDQTQARHAALQLGSSVTVRVCLAVARPRS
ncbi:4-(cytidine 5'-diphospho)-2-C-methyl-D-erythritol kinase [candidate division KSB1 bacterium]|nr:4-(cytidine 5'-diphospho)-2-C-methyl-D-erythritol kinase [candidate division KSB1 bacterium]